MENYRNGIPILGSSYLNIWKFPSSSSLNDEEGSLLPLCSSRSGLARVIRPIGGFITPLFTISMEVQGRFGVVMMILFSLPLLETFVARILMSTFLIFFQWMASISISILSYYALDLMNPKWSCHVSFLHSHY